MSTPKDKKMTNNENQSEQEQSSRKNKLYLVLLVVLGAVVGTWFWWSSGGNPDGGTTIPSYIVRRGDLRVTVSAGGTIQAMESFDVKSKVEGKSQILEVVSEGTVITDEDVENGKVLVRLDSSDLEEKESKQSIDVEDAKANLTQAREAYSIQEQENESNRSNARLDVKFARLEIQRYLGRELADKVMDEGVEFSSIGEREDLGGEAKQQKRELESEVMLGDEELSRAEDTLDWTAKLVENGYVNRDEEVADELKVKRRETNLQKAQAELDLFLRYTLPKEAEQRYEDLREMMRERERVKARCRSELAKTKSTLRSRESTFDSKEDRLEKIRKMIDNSVIRAEKTGMVIYASTINPHQFRNNPIQEGADIREGQTIISIPDLSTLGARVEINETDIRSVREGQAATITVQAAGNQSFEGEVARVSPMAKSEHRWLNPDVMVYDSDVALKEERGKIQPGMSATTEIVVADLQDVLTVPVQAVNTRKGRRVCWVATDDGLRLQEVETGHFTDTLVEIRRGLEEQDEVLLASPDVGSSDVKVTTLPEQEEDEEAGMPADGDQDPASLDSQSEQRAGEKDQETDQQEAQEDTR